MSELGELLEQFYTLRRGWRTCRVCLGRARPAAHAYAHKTGCPVSKLDALLRRQAQHEVRTGVM